MSRCGCSSGSAAGVSFLDSATVDMSGVGSVGNPFVADVKLSDDAGNLLEERDDGLFIGDSEWTAYTPTWTSLGGTTGIGNGVLAGRYLRIGALLFLRIYFLGGTTTGFGGVFWSFSLPAGMVADGSGVNRHAGLLVAAGVDQSAGKLYSGSAEAPEEGSYVGPIYLGDNATGPSLVGATAPFTWADGDSLKISGVLGVA